MFSLKKNIKLTKFELISQKKWWDAIEIVLINKIRIFIILKSNSTIWLIKQGFSFPIHFDVRLNQWVEIKCVVMMMYSNFYLSLIETRMLYFYAVVKTTIKIMM